MADFRQGGRPRDRSRSPGYRSRSRSPREWKRSERGPADRDPHAKIRLFVSNIPYDMRWQDLKDLFREKVGSDVTYVELYDGADGNPTGSGVVEVKGKDVADKAISILHRYELKGKNDSKGRQMIVREERDKDRVKFRRPTDGGRGGDIRDIRDLRDLRDIRSGGGGGLMNMQGGSAAQNALASAASGLMGGAAGMLGGVLDPSVNVMNMLGGGGLLNMLAGNAMNPMQILNQLGIDPSTITNQVFVANLDYKVNVAKLEEVFKIAGNVIEVDLKSDKDGRSRGMATIRFEHPMEAVQAIALFNQQTLYDRQVAVRMDKWVEPVLQDVPNRLPSGLKGIGAGFGLAGQPLLNIAQISNTLTLSALTGQLSMPFGNLAGAMANNVAAAAALNSLTGGNMMGVGNNANLSGAVADLNAAAASFANRSNMLASVASGMPSGMGSSSITTNANLMASNMSNMSAQGMGGSLGGNFGGNLGGNLSSAMGGNLSSMSASLGLGSSLNDSNMMSAALAANSSLGSRMGAGLGSMSDARDLGMQSNLGPSSSSMGGNQLGRFDRSYEDLDRSIGDGLTRGLSSSFDRGNTAGGGYDRLSGGGGGGAYDRGGDRGSDIDRSDSLTVFVKNLPFTYSWRDLMDRFKICGDVRTAQVKMDNGRSRGIGTVSFYSPDDARRAVTIMNGALCEGRQIEVRLDKFGK